MQLLLKVKGQIVYKKWQFQVVVARIRRLISLILPALIQTATPQSITYLDQTSCTRRTVKNNNCIGTLWFRQRLRSVWTSFRLLLSLQSGFNFFVCFTDGWRRYISWKWSTGIWNTSRGLLRGRDRLLSEITPNIRHCMQRALPVLQQ